MKSTVEACAQRDENDHYAKARRGEYQNFPDVDAVYEAPENAEFTVDVDEKTTDEAALQIVDYLKKNFLNC